MNDNDYAKQYVSLIKKIIQQEQKKQNGVTVYYGKVITANVAVNAKCDVSLTSYNGNVYDILNKSNEALVSGNNVIIIAINDSLSNAYISAKMGGVT